MSQENVEIIARLYDEVLSRPERMTSPGAAFELFDAEVELRQTTSILGTEGTFHGRDGLIRAMLEIFAVFRDCRWVATRLADNGDQVVAMWEFHGQGRQSGVEVRETGAHLYTLRGGRIVACHVYLDTAEALEAAGLRE